MIANINEYTHVLAYSGRRINLIWFDENKVFLFVSYQKWICFEIAFSYKSFNLLMQLCFGYVFCVMIRMMVNRKNHLNFQIENRIPFPISATSVRWIEIEPSAWHSVFGVSFPFSQWFSFLFHRLKSAITFKRTKENNKLCTKLDGMCEIRQICTNRMSLSLRELTEIGRGRGVRGKLSWEYKCVCSK